MNYAKEFFSDDEQITRAALTYLQSQTRKDKTKHKVFEAAESFVNVHPTNALLRNTLHYLFQENKPFTKKKNEALRQIQKTRETIANLLNSKILSGSVVFVFPYSLEIRNILSQIPKNKKFSLTTLNAGYYVPPKSRDMKVFLDIEAREIIKKADIVLLSPKVITRKGGLAGVKGLSLCCDVARLHQVPVYACTNSLKCDTIDQHIKYIEQFQEVYDFVPEENVLLDKVFPAELTGIISELGILKPIAFLKELKNTYKWL